MFAHSRFPKNRVVDIQTYIGGLQTPSPVTATGWRTWLKPKTASMVMIVCVGSGACGGDGGSSASSGGGGAGGGGSGALASLVIPAMFLPRVLYVLAANGGAVDDVNGSSSCVCDAPNTAGVAANTVVVSGATGSLHGSDGNAGPSGAAGPGGAGETIATASLSAYAGYGEWTAIAGQAGGNGGNGTSGAPVVGSAVTWGAGGIPLCGGAGGGGADGTTAANGGAVTGAGLMPTVTAGVAAIGNNGVSLWEPMLFSGGSGGAGGTSGIKGFDGGHGAPGCGGGGSGGGNTNLQASGGVGGPGFVIILSW